MRTIKSTYATYEGKNEIVTVFRSYLESKWASLFDCLDLVWVYEPAIIQLSQNSFYIPDFFVKGLGFIEIKPTIELLINESAHKLTAASKLITGSHTNLKILSFAAPSPFFGRNSPTFEFIQWNDTHALKLKKQDVLALLYEISPILQRRGITGIDPILEGFVNIANHLQEQPLTIESISKKLIYNFGINSSQEVHSFEKSGQMNRITLNKIVKDYFDEMDLQIQQMFSLSA